MTRLASGARPRLPLFRRHFRRFLAGGLILAILACSGEPEAAPPGEGPPGERVVEFPELPRFERSIDGGETHRYPLALEMDSYVQVVVEQRGADVGLTAVDPEGRVLPVVDSPTGTEGAERLDLLAKEAGTWWLEVRAAAPGGAYRAWIEARRPASGADRIHVRAEESFWMGRQRRREGDLAAAISLYQESIGLWQSIGRGDRRAAALYRLGLVQEEAREEREALETYGRAAALFQEIGDERYQALSLDRLGHLHLGQGELRPARQSFDQARVLFQRVGGIVEVGSMEVNLGLVDRRDGRPEEAMGHFARALEIFRVHGNGEQRANALNHLGLLYASRGDHPRALAQYAQALEVAGEIDPPVRATTLSNQGHVYVETGRYEKALGVYRQALALQHRQGDRRGEAVTLAGMGLAYRRTEDLAAARRAYEQSLAAFEALGEPYAEAAARNNLGWLRVEAAEPEAALEEFERALELARRLHHLRVEAGVLFGMARAERQRDNRATALAYLEQAAVRMEDFRAQTLRDDLRIAQLASAQELYDTYAELLMEGHAEDPGAGLDRRAFQVSERGRARNFLETLSGPTGYGQQQEGSPWGRELKDLGEQINAQERRRQRLLEDEGSPEARREVERRIDALIDHHSRLLAEIRAESGGMAGLVGPAPVAVEEIQALLDRQTLLLEYHLGRERSFLWIVGKDRFVSLVLPAREILEEWALVAHRRLQRSHLESGFRPTARALEIVAGHLLEPAAPHLQGQRLLVVLPGALQMVPFAVLPLKGEPLLTRSEVVSLPSASVLAVLARRSVSGREVAAGSAEPSLAILADPVFQRSDPRMQGRGAADGGVNFPRLDHSATEAQAILDLLPPNARVREARGFEAHRDLVLEGGLAPYRYLHFATHATLDTGRPELSALVLSAFRESGEARPARLHAYEIYPLHLSAELVVLSACETGLGQEVRGEGMVGLSRAFLFAGAESVLVSLWRVGDRSTAELMTRFYPLLLTEGLPPAAALRRAQESMWRDGWAPYHWAGFVLQGLPGPMAN